MPSIALPVSLRGQLLYSTAFDPSRLVVGSTALVWLDPSDLTTLFQDAAGTTPVTAPGQPVGLALDKSGNGFHATSSGTSRPTYGVVPSRGRVNIYTQTADLTNTTNWPTGNISNGTRSGAGVSVTTNEGFAYIARPVNSDTFTSGVNYTFSATVVCDQTVSNIPIRFSTPFGSAAALTSLTANVSQRIFISVTASASGTGRSEFGIDARNAIVPGGSDLTGYTVTFSNPQLETGSTATPYQRVVSAFDVTEAGAPSLSYLGFDGIDDFMVTPTITPNADKVQVFAGVRKLSDAATGILVESSATIGSNSGAFNITAPSGAAQPTYALNSKGTALSSATAPTSFAAPITNVLTGLGDISGDLATLRVNGTQVAQNTADQGTGNYLAHPLFIGRRGGTSLAFNGQLFSLIVRFSTANLDASLISQTERWMGGKTGVTIA